MTERIAQLAPYARRLWPPFALAVLLGRAVFGGLPDRKVPRLALYSGYAVTAIVVDLRLPGLGGMEFLRLLAADPRLRRTPVVVCSGASDLTQVYGSELATLGHEIVHKPFELEDLIGSVRRAVWSSQSSW